MIKKYLINDQEQEVHITYQDEKKIVFTLDDQEYEYELKATHRDGMVLASNNKLLRVASHYHTKERAYSFSYDGQDVEIAMASSTGKRRKSGDDDKKITAPMTGKVFKLLAKEGQEVKIGDPLIILEAMKMEHVLKAKVEGIVTEIPYQEGELVQGGVEVIKIEES